VSSSDIQLSTDRHVGAVDHQLDAVDARNPSGALDHVVREPEDSLGARPLTEFGLHDTGELVVPDGCQANRYSALFWGNIPNCPEALFEEVSQCGIQYPSSFRMPPFRGDPINELGQI